MGRELARGDGLGLLVATRKAAQTVSARDWPFAALHRPAIPAAHQAGEPRCLLDGAPFSLQDSVLTPRRARWWRNNRSLTSAQLQNFQFRGALVQLTCGLPSTVPMRQAGLPLYCQQGMKKLLPKPRVSGRPASGEAGWVSRQPVRRAIDG